MELVNVFIALLLAVLIGAFFTYVFSIRGPWGKFWSFVLILFLVIWAAEFWVAPVGPHLYNVAWIPLLIVGLVTALLLAAVSPQSKMPSKNENKIEKEDQAAVNIFGTFFWVLIFTLLVIIVAGLFVEI